MNASHVQPFSVEEVSIALYQMSPLRAPGPDGIFVSFFPKILGVP
jgi:hypothetical protein